MHSALRRPKRKLCYITDKECPSKEWAAKVSLGDIDRMFDDLEPSSHDEDNDLLPTPLLHISDNEREDITKELPRQQGCREKDVSPELRPLSTELDIGLDCLSKGDGPVKTSSPIEKKSAGDCKEDVHDRNKGVVSPIIFHNDSNGVEEPNMDNRCNETDLESPPSKVALNRRKMSHDKDTAQISRQKSPGLTASTVRRKPEARTTVGESKTAPEQPFLEAPSCAEKDVTTFLQKLRDAAQSKPSRAKKSLTPVKVVSPPVPEDDFLILEDEGPFWISIPGRATTSKKPIRASSTEKDSSSNKRAKGSPPGSAPEQPQTDQANDKPEPQNISRKVKKKGGEKSEAAGHGNKGDVMHSPEKPHSGGVNEPQKPSKKNHPKEVLSQDGEKAEEQPQNTVRRASGGRGKGTVKKENRKKNSKDMKTGKDGSDVKSSKVSQKVPQNMALDNATVAQNQDMDCVGPSDFNEKDEDKQSKIAAVPEEASPGDSHVITKRKRRQPGEWWVSSSQGLQETDVTDSQPTPKKSQQNKNKPKTALISPVNAKKDGAAKKRNRKQLVQSPVQKTQTLKKGNKVKKDKQNNNLNLKGCTPGRRKLFEVEAEQIECQEVMDQDVGPLHSSPLDLPERNHNLNSSIQVFQKEFQHVSSEKQSSRPAAASPKKSEEQPSPVEPVKRRRRPPSNWWKTKGSSEDLESDSVQHQKQEVKRHKERKKHLKQIKSPGLKTPQNDNVSISPIPAEGAPPPVLGAKPPSAPKTVKRSLATFKEIFTSATENSAVRGHRKAALNNKHMVTSRPAAEITVTECSAGGEDHAAVAAVTSMEAGEPKSTNNQQPPESSHNESDNMLKSLRSGPLSMIELQQYEDNDDMNLPSSRVEAVLSASDLCGPPLKALILLPKDKDNLTRWFKSLWSVTADRGPEITPDDFAWYFYKDRAIGIQEDVSCGSFCSGKLLLGSFMKKPLWVDHSANTVFQLLTSSVKVSINGRESQFAPAQSFVVQSGEAYSIHNVMAQPAVLYFTRMYAESPD